MIKRSVSHKYFLICFICVLMSVILLGLLFLGFSVSYFEKDKYNMMSRNANVAASITSKNYSDNFYVYLDETIIGTTYGVLAKTINAEFFLVGLDGGVIYHSNPEYLTSDSELFIPPEIIDKAKDGTYEDTGVLPGLPPDQPCYIVGVPVDVVDKPVAVLFATSPAGDLVEYLKSVFKIFLLAAGIVCIIAFVIISYFTNRMVKPLKQMLDATNSFSKGDFSKRIPVAGNDEIGQLARAFNNMASTLAVTESSRRSFIANVSHELKTPMTTIGGFVDGILDGTIPYEKQDEYLGIVSSEVKRLSRMVRSMLDTTRIEAGEMELNLTTFDISELVRQSIFSFEQRVEEKELTLEGLEVDHIMVVADRDLMHQVVYNLIENAVKFVNIGGTISVFYKKEGNSIKTTIRNTGSGLSKEEANKIFDRFYKSDRSRTDQSGGVGLGLHIVRSILNYHKGDIACNSMQGEYTEFVFTIPAADENGEKNSSNEEDASEKL